MTLGAHLLGRTQPPDTRHLELHPFVPLRTQAPAQGIEVDIPRPTLSAYDQKNTPKCVGYSTSKVMNYFNRYAFDADWLYAECKKIDGIPGQDGTNARAACDVLRAKGHWRTISGKPVKAGPKLAHGISSNHWATSVDGIRSVFAQAAPEPVLIGINWYDAWFQPATNQGEHWLQQPTGPIAGGHEIGIYACSDKRQAFGLSNTWGNLFPDLVWLPYTTMTTLFRDGADACVIQDLPTR